MVCYKKVGINISEKIAREFAIQTLSFWGHDFDEKYSMIKEMLSKETIISLEFGMEPAIICGMLDAVTLKAGDVAFKKYVMPVKHLVQMNRSYCPWWEYYA